jgi:hypothetical protein
VQVVVLSCVSQCLRFTDFRVDVGGVVGRAQVRKLI